MLQTRFTAKFACRYPIMLAPMAGVSGGKLAAAVAHGGGFPFIAGGHGDRIDALANEVCSVACRHRIWA
jgi:nitronate monooxygenase